MLAVVVKPRSRFSAFLASRALGGCVLLVNASSAENRSSFKAIIGPLLLCEGGIDDEDPAAAKDMLVIPEESEFIPILSLPLGVGTGICISCICVCIVGLLFILLFID